MNYTLLFNALIALANVTAGQQEPPGDVELAFQGMNNETLLLIADIVSFETENYTETVRILALSGLERSR
jgi:hypothetical protein